MAKETFAVTKSKRGIRHRPTQLIVAGVVLTLAVAGVVGYTVWFVFNSRQVADTAYKQANAVSSNTPHATPTVKDFDSCKKAAGSKLLETYPEQCLTKNGKTFTDDSQRYLTITEWGVKVPLSAVIFDAVYLVRPDVPDGAYLSLASLGNTACKVDGVSMGAYFRFKQGDKDIAGRSMVKQLPDAVKIGTYYYAFQYPQDGCVDQIGADRITAVQHAFEAAIKSVVAE